MNQSTLETRTCVLETKVDYLEERFGEQSEQLDAINEVMHEVKNHIAKQNGALPRIESYIKECAARLTTVETSANTRAIEAAAEHATINQKTINTKEKLRYAVVIVGFFLATGIGALANHFFLHVFGG